MKMILLILDGFGLKRNSKTVNKKNCPFIFNLMKKYFYIPLRASGRYVGLYKNNMGNSEVGHQTIGSGRITIQPSVFITENELKNFFSSYEIKEKEIALIGMASDGNIHSSLNHIIYIYKILKKLNKKILFHMISDGRDTKRKDVKKYTDILKNEKINISSISGRYYAMDRDNNYDRTDLFCNMIKSPTKKNFNLDDVIFNSYKNNVTDEFFLPTLLRKDDTIKSDTFLIFCNFRADRMKQLFNKLKNYNSLSMVPYDNNKNCIFHQKEIKETLGKILLRNKLRDCRIAESEKKNHITYFLNGNRYKPYKNQKNIIIKSDKKVTPNMKIDLIVREIKKNISKYEFITCNIANGDMVGHLGDINKSIQAVKIIDKNIKKIYKITRENNFLLIITADHGNIEVPNEKTHTTNKVPLIICSRYYEKSNINKASLKNILPTICQMGKFKNKIKSSNSLIKKF